MLAELIIGGSLTSFEIIATVREVRGASARFTNQLINHR